MGSSLQQRFQRRAGLVLVAGALTASFTAVAVPQTQAQDLNISELVPTGKVCIARSSAANPQTPVERYFAHQYESQKSTRVGRMLLDVGGAAMSTICFDRALDEEDNCGSSLDGTTIDGGIALNPGEGINPGELELTLIHETRHLQQSKFHLSYGVEGNVPEASRVAMYWLVEADARMTEIIYGYEKGLRGDDVYTDIMDNDDDYEPMMKAFYGSLAKNPGQMQAALEAGMKGFLKAKVMTLSYANEAADWIRGAQAEFDPAQPATPIFIAEDLRNAGDMAGFGNTMTPAVVKAFRAAVTQQDYARLLKARELNNGERTCKPS